MHFVRPERSGSSAIASVRNAAGGGLPESSGGPAPSHRVDRLRMTPGLRCIGFFCRLHKKKTDEGLYE